MCKGRVVVCIYIVKIPSYIIYYSLPPCFLDSLLSDFH